MLQNKALLSQTEQRALALRLTLALAAAGCLILSVGLEALNPSQRDVAQLVAGIAAVLVGWPALTAAWRSLQHPDLHGITDQLIALAFIAAWASGDLVTASLLPLIMTVGHILEERSLLGTHEAIRALTKLTQTTARRIEAGGIVEVAASILKPGDLIEVRAGDRIPADGRVETALAPVLGALTSLALSLSDGMIAVVLALFSGFFLYISASDLLPESHHAHPRLLTTLATFAGAACLYCVTQIAH